MSNVLSPIARARACNFSELRFENASFKYRGSNKALFENFDLALPLGKNVWITGAAGGGQSTLLKLITLVTPLTAGSFFVNGADAARMSFEEFLHLRLKIGYTFDYGGLFSNRTLLENLTLPLVYHKIYSPSDAEDYVHGFADRFRFSSHLGLRPAMVSGGLRKLACILRAMLLQPEMLVMDDPFTAIDPEAARSLLKLIEEGRAEGHLKHVFLTSRDESWVEKLNPELLVIENGFAAQYSSERSERVG